MTRQLSQNSINRRTLLKTASVVGIGSVVAGCSDRVSAQASASLSTGFSVEDITITVTDGEVSEMGLEAIWYEADWEDITGDLQIYHAFTVRDPEMNNNRIGTAVFDVPEDGTDTWGYGTQYEENFENELTADDFTDDPYADDDEPPLSTEDGEFLEQFEVEEEGDTITRDVDLELECLHSTEDSLDFLDSTIEEFTVTVDWEELDPHAEVTTGEAQPFGED